MPNQTLTTCRTMTNTDTDYDPTVDREAIRKAITAALRSTDTPPARGTLRKRVTEQVDADAAAVDHELDALERVGLIYLVGKGDAAEVKRP